MSSQFVFVTHVTGEVAIDHQSKWTAVEVGKHCRGCIGEPDRTHECLGSRVVHDVGGFFGGQILVHGTQVHARPDSGPIHLVIPKVVLHEQRHDITGNQTLTLEQPGKTNTSLVELAVRKRFARWQHDRCDLAGILCGMNGHWHDWVPWRYLVSVDSEDSAPGP